MREVENPRLHIAPESVAAANMNRLTLFRPSRPGAAYELLAFPNHGLLARTDRTYRTLSGAWPDSALDQKPCRATTLGRQPLPLFALEAVWTDDTRSGPDGLPTTIYIPVDPRGHIIAHQLLLLLLFNQTHDPFCLSASEHQPRSDPASSLDPV